MIIKYDQKWMNKIFGGYFWGFAVWPFILYKLPKSEMSPWRERHEEEHIKQQLNALWFWYFIRYFTELFWNKFYKKMSWEDAYTNISYERQARKAEKRWQND